jgi:hypothetical protein
MDGAQGAEKFDVITNQYGHGGAVDDLEIRCIELIARKKDVFI